MPRSSAQEDWARWRVEHSGIVAANDSLVVIAIVLELAAVIGFFYVLRRAGALTWIGLVLWLVGLQLVLLEHISFIVINQWLSPKYLAASEAARPAIDAVIFALWRLAMVAAGIGNKLVVCAGVPIFAAASLRFLPIPKWIGWFGLFVGGLSWVPIRYWPPPAFVGFMLWMFIMGIVWVRLPDERVTIAGSR